MKQDAPVLASVATEVGAAPMDSQRNVPAEFIYFLSLFHVVRYLNKILEFFCFFFKARNNDTFLSSLFAAVGVLHTSVITYTWSWACSCLVAFSWLGSLEKYVNHQRLLHNNHNLGKKDQQKPKKCLSKWPGTDVSAGNSFLP